MDVKWGTDNWSPTQDLQHSFAYLVSSRSFCYARVAVPVSTPTVSVTVSGTFFRYSLNMFLLLPAPGSTTAGELRVQLPRPTGTTAITAATTLSRICYPFQYVHSRYCAEPFSDWACSRSEKGRGHKSKPHSSSFVVCVTSTVEPRKFL